MTRHQRNLAIAGDFETSRESTAFETTGEEVDTTTAVPAINEASELSYSSPPIRASPYNISLCQVYAPTSLAADTEMAAILLLQ